MLASASASVAVVVHLRSVRFDPLVAEFVKVTHLESVMALVVLEPAERAASVQELALRSASYEGAFPDCLLKQPGT